MIKSTKSTKPLIFTIFTNCTLFQDEFAVPTGRVKQRKERKDESDEFIDEKLSKQILNQARLQMQDLQNETKTQGAPAPARLPKLGDNLDSDDEDGEDDLESLVDDDEKSFNDEAKKNYNMSKKDEEAFERFMNSENGPRKTLGKYLDKIDDIAQWSIFPKVETFRV